MKVELWEQREEEEGDIYTELGVEEGIKSDGLKPAEEGFMMGYLWAG